MATKSIVKQVRQPAAEGADVIFNEGSFDFYVDGQFKGSRENSQDAWICARSLYFEGIEQAAHETADMVAAAAELEHEACIGGDDVVTYAGDYAESCRVAVALPPLDICPFCNQVRDDLGRCGCDYEPTEAELHAYAAEWDTAAVAAATATAWDAYAATWEWGAEAWDVTPEPAAISAVAAPLAFSAGSVRLFVDAPDQCVLATERDILSPADLRALIALCDRPDVRQWAGAPMRHKAA